MSADTQSVAEKYQSMDQKEHILRRPGMYMGDIHKDKHNVFITEHGIKEITATPSLEAKKPAKRTRRTKKDVSESIGEINPQGDDVASEISDTSTTTTTTITTTTTTPVETKEIERTRILMKEIILVPGFMSIIEEVLVNANDQKYRLDQSIAKGEKVLPVTEIHINVDISSGRITIANNGEGIDIEKHPKTNLFVPQMIFSELLTSGNYDDTKERVTGGQMESV